MQDLDFDFLEIHTSEKMRVGKFYKETCQCKLAADEKPCSTTLKIDDLVTVEITPVNSHPLNLT